MPAETDHVEEGEHGDPRGDVELPVCPNCMAPGSPFDGFCRECGCPLSPLTGFDPIGMIWSQGFVFRQAATGRVSKMTAVLLWLWLGPAPLAYAGSVIWWAAAGPSRSSVVGALAVFARVFLLPSLLLYRVTANYLRQRQLPDDFDDPGEDGGETGG